MKENMTPAQRYLPWGVVTVAGLYLAYCAMPVRSDAQFDLEKFGTIPVVNNGRLQPLDSVARSALMIVSGRQSFVEELPNETKVRRPPIRWLIDMWTQKGANHKVIRIENDTVLGILGLQPREGLRYSLAEIMGSSQSPSKGYALAREMARKAERKDAKERDLVDAKLSELFGHLEVLRAVINQATILPPTGETVPIGSLVAQQAAFEQGESGGVDNPWGKFFLQLEIDYSSGSGAESQKDRANAVEFNRSLDAKLAALRKQIPSDTTRAAFETFYNRFAPFYAANVLYVFVMILSVVSWLAWPQPMRHSAFALCILAFVLHTAALIARMYLMERWWVFVTNLYSSAIFIGWGCVLVGLFLEYVFPISVGSLVGSVTGSLSLIIAHFLSFSGSADTLEKLVAVLDTNFWLATHVTCVTFGYTATFVAGFIGIGYVVAGIAAPNLSRETTQIFTRMIYGVICFATLLSFTGTVLGGIWADQSWGRFWGWDPKENGALLIVLMNALTLHARWGGMIKARGLAVLAILGNVVTAWSWFGVNMLGVGLHSYGFMEGAAFWLIAFVVSQLLLAGLGMFDPATIRQFFVNALALTPPAVPPAGTAPVPGDQAQMASANK